MKRVKVLSDGDSIGITVVEINDVAGAERLIIISSEHFAIFKKSTGDLYVGMELDGDTIETLDAMAELYSAVRRGMNMLSFGEVSEKRLSDKLRMKGVSRDTAAAAAAYIKEHGGIDEGNQAAAAARSYAKKLYGRRRIAAELSAHGYTKESVAEALEIIDSEVDFQESCAALIEKKWGAPPYEREDTPKIAAQMQRYGHDFADIRRALRNNR